MNDALKNFLFIDQLKIMGYGESDTSGCWLKFLITPELLEIVRGRKGEMVEVAARLINNAGAYIPSETTMVAPAVDPGSHGEYWRRIIAFGFFHAIPVLSAIGTDQQFLEWVRRQPSAISGKMDYDTDTGEGGCVAAHVRRVSEGSGTGIKPEYYAIPLTDAEHKRQHQHGERAKQWFERQANKYRKDWASKTLAAILGYTRRSDCPAGAVKAWAELKELTQYFPVDTQTQ